MATPQYKRQYRAEMAAKKILEGHGYTVIRSVKSVGVFDLVGFNSKKMIVVQIKTCPVGEVSIFLKTKEKMKEVKIPKNCKRELWVKEGRKGWHYFPV